MSLRGMKQPHRLHIERDEVASFLAITIGNNYTMILEVAILNVIPGLEDDFFSSIF